jgi:hypothetical protein
MISFCRGFHVVQGREPGSSTLFEGGEASDTLCARPVRLNDRLSGLGQHLLRYVSMNLLVETNWSHTVTILHRTASLACVKTV